MTLALYRAGAQLATPLIRWLASARADRGKEDPERIAERFGQASRARPQGPLVWLHAAGVGEAVSVLPVRTNTAP